MPLFVQSEPISPFVRHCMGVGLYEEVPALGFTSTTRAQPIWCSTKCHSACIYPCPPPTPRARSEIMRGLHPAIAPRGENTVQLAHMSCTGWPIQNSACARRQPAGSQAARWPAAAAGRGPNRLSYRIVWADFPIRLLMDSTAGTEPAATSEQPARSPAKARKYNFGRPRT